MAEVAPAVIKVADTKSTAAPQVAPESSVTPNNDTYEVIATPRYILHGASFLFSIIALACSAAAESTFSTTSTDFLLFVAASAFILNLIFVPLYLVHPRMNGIVTPYWLSVVETVIAAIWTVFWFAGAIAYAVDAPQCFKVTGTSFKTCDKSTQDSAIVFSFFACAVWAALTAFAALHVFRASRGGATTGASA